MLLTGCTSLAERIAEPHTDRQFGSIAVRDTLENANGIIRATMTARGGNRIAYRVVPSADYRMQYTYKRTANGANFDFKVPNHRAPVESKGTVIYLHGWGDDHNTMLIWALALARYGYTGILPDLRNHGESDRAPAGYGPREGQDVVDLIASLRQRGELQAPVYLFGVSYGATTAINAAADPTAKIDGVIAMEPFVNAGKGIRGMIAAMRKMPANVVGDQLTTTYMQRAYDAPEVDRAIAAADARLKLDLDSIDVSSLLRGGTTCTLVLEGTHDGVFDPADLRVFANAPRVRYLEFPNENHFTLPMRIDLLSEPLAGWLAQAAQCPSLPLPQEHFQKP
jgi:pimeloyl-ACP methyl ester carboxylesterase